MKKLPKVLIRVSDGAEFILNENNKYELKSMQKFKKKGHLIMEWDYESLMAHKRCFVEKKYNRCEYCGQFLSPNTANFKFTPDSDYSTEESYFVCNKCNG
jgi:uncharacterized protein with PIN domain